MNFYAILPTFNKKMELTLELAPNEFEDKSDKLGLFEAEGDVTEYLTVY